MKKEMIVYLLVAMWILVFAQSFWAGAGTDEPRNIDTGFRRLDVFFRFQLVAFMLAIALAIVGFYYSSGRKWLRLAGFAPLAVTLIFVISIVVVTLTSDTARVPSFEKPGQATTAN